MPVFNISNINANEIAGPDVLKSTAQVGARLLQMTDAWADFQKSLNRISGANITAGAADVGNQGEWGNWITQDASQNMSRLYESKKTYKSSFFEEMARASRAALQDVSADLLDMETNAKNAFTNIFSNMSDCLEVTNLKIEVDWKRMLDTILQESLRHMVVNPVLGFLTGKGASWLGDWLGADSSLGGGMGIDKSLSNKAFKFHSGGVAGYSAHAVQRVPDSLFHGAPRYHSGGVAGLLPNEVPAILERGEAVVPADVASTLAPLSAVRAASGGNMEVNIIDNRSGDAPAVRTEQSSLADGGMRLDVFIDDIDRAIGQRIASGRSAIGRAFDRTRGTSTGPALYRR